MDRVRICAECGKPLDRVALIRLVVTYEVDESDGEMFEQLWHRMCFVEYQSRLTRVQPDQAGSADGEDRAVDARQVSSDS